MPKIAAEIISRGQESVAKKPNMPIKKVTFRIILKVKKSTRSNTRPQKGLLSSRDRFGTTERINATSPSESFSPYLSLARYSTRSGTIIKKANPRNIHAIVVPRRTSSVFRYRKQEKIDLDSEIPTLTGRREEKNAAPAIAAATMPRRYG
jgi:hypothetical protein